MKSAPAILLLALIPAGARAAEFEFWLNRFGAIKLTTTKGAEKILFEQGNKEGEDITFQSKLKTADGGIFTTSGGTTFKLEKLAKAVVHDGNRGLNSGGWKLTLVSAGGDAEKIRKALPFVVFPENYKKEEYFGTKSAD